MAASIPPMPSPVTTRQMDKDMMLVAVVAPTMPAAITARQPRIVGRRPILSATPPTNTDPIAMPMSSIESTTPSAPRSMPHSFAMPGDAKLMDSTSKPSSAFRQTVIAMTTSCRRLIGEVAMTSRGSLFMDRA